ncbi:two component transcriptional regulator, LytTR family [Desulfuromusa kysingii]|uniref:Two component transcriptional regulator, LytTR family n=1 Tax=Desulfuromusa kysingii TaxID=37625 RepID=A0A1H4CJ52_9BACT|nr:two-component system response regulator BtsR [Desulfuromusa kysingii]SEA60359.1 two component transcriptional regulator, LytTR family [Desulfuromusa kysingii]
MIRALIIDDEQHAREELEHLVRATGVFEILGSCTNVIDALRKIRTEKPELIFLDIEMPALNGFELLAMLEDELMPHVVFVTAYNEYALKSFEEKTLDYLLKPVSPQRLLKTVNKVRDMIRRGDPPRYQAESLSHIPCQFANRVKFISPATVDYVYSDVAGIYVVTHDGHFFTELTLRVLEERTALLRCQRQYLVNPERIDEIIFFANGLGEIKTRAGNTLPVSRRYLRQLKVSLQL